MLVPRPAPSVHAAGALLGHVPRRRHAAAGGWHVDPKDVPPHVRHLFAERDGGTAKKDTPALFACTEAEVRPLIALTYGMITMIDDAVARILAALERSGLANDTIVIFTSDHGDLMGDHQLHAERPGALRGRDPRAVHLAGDRRSAARGRRDGLAATIDLPSTILDRAGVDAVQRHARRFADAGDRRLRSRACAMPC